MASPRRTVSGKRVPIASANSSRCRPWASFRSRPAAPRSRSPVRSPATAAGLPATTSTTRSAVVRPSRSCWRAGTGLGAVTSPRYARRTLPSATRDWMIRRVVVLIGTASPSPAPATAVLIPTTRARPSARAPPELPGLRAASVWITSSMIRVARPECAGIARPRPLTTPTDTDPAKPKGLPTATTSWPTTSASASPKRAADGVPPLARSTARSESGSRPTTSTAQSVPSGNAAVPPRAPATTWALVTRYPSSVSMTADPVPLRRGPRISTAATWGPTAAATRATVALNPSRDCPPGACGSCRSSGSVGSDGSGRAAAMPPQRRAAARHSRVRGGRIGLRGPWRRPRGPGTAGRPARGTGGSARWASRQPSPVRHCPPCPAPPRPPAGRRLR